MKKSEIFYKAQLAVVKAISLTPEEKLEIIVELEDKRTSALYWEREEAKAAAEAVEE